MESTKKCSICKIEKPLTEFGKIRANSDKLRAACKKCASEYAKKNRVKAQEKVMPKQFESSHSVKVGRITEYRIRLKCLKEEMRITIPLQQQKGFDLIVITGPRTHDRWQIKTAHMAGTSKWWAHVGDPKSYEYLVVAHPTRDIFWKVPSKEIPAAKKPIRMNNRWMWE